MLMLSVRRLLRADPEQRERDHIGGEADDAKDAQHGSANEREVQGQQRGRGARDLQQQQHRV